MKLTALFTVAFLGFATAHSWLDELTVIGGKNPSPGQRGVHRGNTLGVHSDALSVTKILDLSQPVCRPEHQSPISSDVRLKVYPGNIVQGSYTENGHTTKLSPGGKPGKIYWFGTTDTSTSSLPLSSILEWTPDGKGGNGRGKLITTTNFDDTLCYENPNGSPIREERAKVAGVEALPCVSQFQVPEEVKTGLYTVYWVWDFSTNQPEPKDRVEWYTNCIDLEVVEGSAYRKRNGEFAPGIIRSAKFRGRV